MWESVIVLCFVVRYFMPILVLQSSWWGRESWLLCLVHFLVSHDGWVALPHGAMGLSAVCDCGISWSYSLTIFILAQLLWNPWRYPQMDWNIPWAQEAASFTGCEQISTSWCHFWNATGNSFWSTVVSCVYKQPPRICQGLRSSPLWWQLPAVQAYQLWCWWRISPTRSSWKESGKWSSTQKIVRLFTSAPTNDTRDTPYTGSIVTPLKLLTVENISALPSVTASVGTDM